MSDTLPAVRKACTWAGIQERALVSEKHSAYIHPDLGSRQHRDRRGPAPRYRAEDRRDCSRPAGGKRPAGVAGDAGRQVVGAVVLLDLSAEARVLIEPLPALAAIAAVRPL